MALNLKFIVEQGTSGKKNHPFLLRVILEEDVAICLVSSLYQVQSVHKKTKQIFKVWSLESFFLCICDWKGDFSTLLAEINPLNVLKEPAQSAWWVLFVKQHF
jgi:hypothetical protein